MRVAVIGGGASGLMAAGVCASLGNQVDVFESNEKVGKKLYITGKGRCNVTNYTSPEEILENVVTNAKFLYGSMYAFTSYDTKEFFEKFGVPIKIERGNRAFPQSDKSSDIIRALENFCYKNGVKIHLNQAVNSIDKNGDMFCISTKYGVYDNYNATIICTGGKTYSATGSTGDGYVFAKKFGHLVNEIRPALVPILLSDNFISNIEGLSLKNVTLNSFVDNKAYKSFFGEMLFTSKGISGPIALSLSSYINKKENVSLSIDFKPALTEEKLTARINRDIEQLRDKQVSTLIAGLVPKALVNVFLEKLNLDSTRKNRTLQLGDVTNIVSLLKNFKLKYKGLDNLDFGIITCGGVNVKEVNPKTMESKIVKGLYFAGEVLDVDALTGGFNLQIAFSTAYVAGHLYGFREN